MLESFGSMSVAHVNHTLQDLYSNVSYAKQIFQSGGREDLERTQNQINQVTQIKIVAGGWQPNCLWDICH